MRAASSIHIHGSVKKKVVFFFLCSRRFAQNNAFNFVHRFLGSAFRVLLLHLLHPHVYIYHHVLQYCSGKSTLIGVLSSSGLDDGRGAARSLVLRHRHEQENGRTSAVTMEIMGYAKDGQQVRALSSIAMYSLSIFFFFCSRSSEHAFACFAAPAV